MAAPIAVLIDTGLGDDSNVLAMLARRAPLRHSHDTLGSILLENASVSAANLTEAVLIMGNKHARLDQILLTHGWVTSQSLLAAQSRLWQVPAIDPDIVAPDSRLIDVMGPGFCLRYNILPWRRLGGVTWIATSDPDEFDRLSAFFPASIGKCRMALCSADQIERAILLQRETVLIRRAETCVPDAESCRTWDSRPLAFFCLIALAALSFGLWYNISLAILTFTAIFLIGLITQTTLKLICFTSALRNDAERQKNGRGNDKSHPTAPLTAGPQPKISVIMPLLRESEIALQLIARLSLLAYPRELTEILLVIETTDDVTKSALSGCDLPNWMRVVEVPEGQVLTKPRALCYALNFCKGDIIGIWDAEDCPEPDQLSRVAYRFQHAAPDVGCVQGALDYFNPRSNWIARCFTIEYASWFRVILPALARLGLVVPLGGTTCYFRRDVLDEVDGWDAWNVTEDADLGLRLARRGWRVDILDSTTDEEANCVLTPWIKQRSRWIKGFALTWAVHMRQPVRLWRDLGTKRFLAVQVLFLTLITQFMIAPALWGFWLLSMGWPYPLHASLSALIGSAGITMIVVMFIGAEFLNQAIGFFAVRGPKHRHLRRWMPTIHFYFPLACFAAWKAFYELFARPFYWDKTAHGFYAAPQENDEDGRNKHISIIGPIGEETIALDGGKAGSSSSDQADRPDDLRRAG